LVLLRRVNYGQSAELARVAQPIFRCGEDRCECTRRQVAQSSVRAMIVVVHTPTGERSSGVIEVAEQGLVEASYRIRPLRPEHPRR